MSELPTKSTEVDSFQIFCKSNKMGMEVSEETKNNGEKTEKG